ncbi:MAG: hypothetical protein ACRDRK_22705 [Pseudonocardia sp.]
MARRHGYQVALLTGRGKGSHQIHVLLDAEDHEVGRFSITDHGSKDVSWGVLRTIEEGLADLLGGARWMEKG